MLETSSAQKKKIVIDKKRPRRWRGVSPPTPKSIQFLLGMLGCTAIATTAVLALGPKSSLYRVPDSNTYVEWYRDDVIHFDLLNDVSSFPAAIKKSDVLLLGSSKTLYGLSAEYLTTNLGGEKRFFNLGIAGGEGILLFEQIFSRLDISRKSLIINVDDNFLSLHITKPTQKALSADYFVAATRIMSVRTTAFVETFFDHIGLPRLAPSATGIGVTARDRVRGYRNWFGDSLSPTTIPSHHEAPFQLIPDDNPGTMLSPTLLEADFVKRIISRWHKRGMCFTWITLPYGTGDPRTTPRSYNPAIPLHAVRLYGGTAILLDWKDISSSDGIHVTNAGRQILSQRLSDKLKQQTPTVCEPTGSAATMPLPLERETLERRDAFDKVREILSQHYSAGQLSQSKGWERLDTAVTNVEFTSHELLKKLGKPINSEFLASFYYISDGKDYKLIWVDRLDFLIMGSLKGYNIDSRRPFSITAHSPNARSW